MSSFSGMIPVAPTVFSCYTSISVPTLTFVSRPRCYPTPSPSPLPSLGETTFLGPISGLTVPGTLVHSKVFLLLVPPGPCAFSSFGLKAFSQPALFSSLVQSLDLFVFFLLWHLWHKSTLLSYSYCALTVLNAGSLELRGQ